MRTVVVLSFISSAFLLNTRFALSQDCHALIHERQVSGGIVYSTSPYTMNTPNYESVTITGLTADSAVAVIFSVTRAGKTCVDGEGKAYVRFKDGEEIDMANAAGINCDNQVVIYFSKALGNMDELELFRTKKIRYVKVWITAKIWVKVELADGVAYNFKKSMDCLAHVIGAPEPKQVQPQESTVRYMSPPRFRGGPRALRVYFGKHRHKGIVDKGEVIVSFMVDKEGNVGEPTVLLGVSERIDNEARRLVSSMPKWKPAVTKDGTPVDARVKVAIPF